MSHAARQHPDGKPFVETEGCRHGDDGCETGERDRQRQGDLRQRFLLEAAEELRSYRVADGKEEQIEERPPKQLGQLGPGQESDEDAGDEGTNDRAEADALEVEAADDGAEENAQKQTERREVVKKGRQPFHELPASANSSPSSDACSRITADRGAASTSVGQRTTITTCCR